MAKRNRLWHWRMAYDDDCCNADGWRGLLWDEYGDDGARNDAPSAHHLRSGARCGVWKPNGLTKYIGGRRSRS